MLIVLEIPYQIDYIYKQRNANVTCALRLLIPYSLAQAVFWQQ